MSVEKAMLSAKAHERKGAYQQARSIYEKILADYPHNKRAQHAMEALHTKTSQTEPGETPPTKDIKALLTLHRRNAFSAVCLKSKQILKRYPRSYIVWHVLGLAHAGRAEFLQAQECFQTAIDINPHSAEAYSNLGNALKDQGHSLSAISSYKTAIQLRPNYAEVHHNMGAALLDQGDIGAAIQSYENALAVTDKIPEFHYSLATALRLKGQFAEALACLEKTLDLQPSFADAHHAMAHVLRALGRRKDALVCYQKFLENSPENAEAHNNMGVVLQELGHFKAALRLYARAVSLRLDYAEAHNNIGTVFQELSQFKSALKAYARALEIRPDYAEVHNNIGNTLRDLGKMDDAISYYARAVQYKPNYAAAHNNIGNVLKERGDIDFAISAYSRAVEIDPKYATAHRHLSQVKVFKTTDSQFQVMKNLFDSTDISDADRCEICFALAKAHHDMGAFAQAFGYFKKGNTIRKETLGYEITTDRKLFQDLQDIQFSMKPVAQLDTSATRPPQPIFILGMPRSGTTLVEQIISNHSSVTGGGELPYAWQLGSEFILPHGQTSSADIQKFGEKYLEKIRALSEGRPFVTDKMPQNFRLIGLILCAMPNAKIVHVQRDARAIAWSNYKHYFMSKGLGYCYNLADLVEYFNLYSRLMTSWNARFPAAIYNLNYEQLTENPEPETRRLIDYLELDWEDSCLSPEQNSRSIRTASQQQVRQKVYKGSSQEWLKYAPFLGNAFEKLN